MKLSHAVLLAVALVALAAVAPIAVDAGNVGLAASSMNPLGSSTDSFGSSMDLGSSATSMSSTPHKEHKAKLTPQEKAAKKQAKKDFEANLRTKDPAFAQAQDAIEAAKAALAKNPADAKAITDKYKAKVEMTKIKRAAKSAISGKTPKPIEFNQAKLDKKLLVGKAKAGTLTAQDATQLAKLRAAKRAAKDQKRLQAGKPVLTAEQRAAKKAKKRQAKLAKPGTPAWLKDYYRLKDLAYAGKMTAGQQGRWAALQRQHKAWEKEQKAAKKAKKEAMGPEAWAQAKAAKKSQKLAASGGASRAGMGGM